MLCRRTDYEVVEVVEASPLEPGYVIIALIRVETQFLIEAAEAPP